MRSGIQYLCWICYCSVEDYEAAKRRWHKDSGRSILCYDLLSGCGEIFPSILPHSPMNHNDCACVAVKVALNSQSEVSTQLKAALTVELVDYFIQSNWSPKKQMEVQDKPPNEGQPFYMYTPL